RFQIGSAVREPVRPVATLRSPAKFSLPLSLLSSLDYEPIRLFVVARLESTVGLAPRRHWVPSARGLAFPASLGAVGGVHGQAADGGTDTHRALATGLACGEV